MYDIPAKYLTSMGIIPESYLIQKCHNVTVIIIWTFSFLLQQQHHAAATVAKTATAEAIKALQNETSV